MLHTPFQADNDNYNLFLKKYQTTTLVNTGEGNDGLVVLRKEEEKKLDK